MAKRGLQILPEPLGTDERLADLHRDNLDAQPFAFGLAALIPAFRNRFQARRQFLDDRRFIGQDFLHAHRGDFVFNRGLRLFA